MISKRDKMFRCLKNESYNEPIGSFWYHFPESDWEKDAFIRAHIKYYRETDIDFMKIMEEIRYTFDMKTASDWRSYRPPHRNAPERVEQREAIRAIADEIGEECMVYTTIFDPLRTVGITMGYEYIEYHIRENRSDVSTAFRAMAESIAEYAEDCLKAGADGIFFSSKGAENNRFDPDVFSQIVYEPDLFIGRAIWDISPYTLLHICGFDTDIARYKEFPSAIVNWDCHHGVSLKSGAALFSDKIILGGIKNNNGGLTDGTVDEMKEEIDNTLDSIGNDINRFIVGADCTLPTNIDHERISTAMGFIHNKRQT